MKRRVGESKRAPALLALALAGLGPLAIGSQVNMIGHGHTPEIVIQPAYGNQPGAPYMSLHDKMAIAYTQCGVERPRIARALPDDLLELDFTVGHMTPNPKAENTSGPAFSPGEIDAVGARAVLNGKEYYEPASVQWANDNPTNFDALALVNPRHFTSANTKERVDVFVEVTGALDEQHELLDTVYCGSIAIFGSNGSVASVTETPKIPTIAPNRFAVLPTA